MLVKKEKNTTMYLKFFMLVIFFGLAIFYKQFLVNIYLQTAQYFFGDESLVDLTLTEREELLILRTENVVLKDEISQIRQEFQITDFEEVKSPVYLLIGENTFYGNFFISIPKNKTPYKGMNIFSSGNIVIGQVEEIYPNTLKASKLGQNKAFIATSLENDESVEFRSLGSGLYIGTVSGGSKVSLGDTIVLKGFPKAIVGAVVEIEKKESSLMYIYVRTPYNISKKEIFYVLQ